MTLTEAIQQAEAGDPHVMVHLGHYLYERGDIEEAVRWLAAAADAGYVKAMVPAAALIASEEHVGRLSLAETSEAIDRAMRWNRIAEINGVETDLGEQLAELRENIDIRLGSVAVDAGAPVELPEGSEDSDVAGAEADPDEQGWDGIPEEREDAEDTGEAGEEGSGDAPAESTDETDEQVSSAGEPEWLQDAEEDDGPSDDRTAAAAAGEADFSEADVASFLDAAPRDDAAPVPDIPGIDFTVSDEEACEPVESQPTLDDSGADGLADGDSEKGGQPSEGHAICPHCGNPCSEDAQFCGACGKAMNESEEEPVDEDSDEGFSDLRTCPECGAVVADDAVFCEACGTRIDSGSPEPPAGRACPECGASVSDDAMFCNTCGKRLDEIGPETVEQRTCPECGVAVADGAVFCEVCGTRIDEGVTEPRTCPKCGFVVTDDAMFCEVCGTRI